jgi:cytochrome b involved in lipid metabolism
MRKQFFSKSHYYIFEGKVYDLKDWVNIHPGGSMWFVNSYGRDLTSLVNSYHTNPALIRQIMAKYVTTIPVDDVLHKSFNVPPFILPPDFDADRDMIRFDWKKENTMLD